MRLVTVIIANDKESCFCDSADVHKHMCTLVAQERDESIKSLSDRAIVECRYCGAKANSLKNICATSFLEA